MLTNTWIVKSANYFGLTDKTVNGGMLAISQEKQGKNTK